MSQLQPSPETVREDIVAELERLQAQGRSFVKARDLESTLDYSRQRLGSNLGRLVDEGVVERWGNGGPQVYRITRGKDGGFGD